MREFIEIPLLLNNNFYENKIFLKTLLFIV